MQTYQATLPNGEQITKKSQTALTHVVIGLSSRGRWYDLAWVASEARAIKVTANKTKSQDGWYSSIQYLAVEQLPDKPKSNVAAHTCQLCGRHIHDNTGKIAQHGYEIKFGQEIHTCPGSHHLPYEQDCSLIPPEIARTKAFIADRQMWLFYWIATPPAIITRHLTVFGKGRQAFDYPRPEGFTPFGTNYVSQYGEYAPEWRSSRRQVEAQIRQAAEYVAFLEQRLADWKAPTRTIPVIEHTEQ